MRTQTNTANRNEPLPMLEPSVAKTPDPELGIAKQRIATIKIIHNESEGIGPFWVGLYTNGLINPASLLEENDTTKILMNAAERGVKADGPIMLSDAHHAAPRNLFLLPTPHTDEHSMKVWIKELIQKIHEWAPKSIGFYFDHKNLSDANGLKILKECVCELIRNSNIMEYHLVIGSQGFNAALNTCLKIKSDIESKLQVSVFVFH